MSQDIQSFSKLFSYVRKINLLNSEGRMLNGLQVIDKILYIRMFGKQAVMEKRKDNIKARNTKILLISLVSLLMFGFSIKISICFVEGSEQNLTGIGNQKSILAHQNSVSVQTPLYLRNRILADDTSTSDTIQKYVVLLIIIFFVVVPVTAILIFIGLFIYKKCQQNSQESDQNRVEQTPEINLDSYNIDQMGPYIANSNDQCSICLDNQVNLRTFCGHFFHAPCLKTWFDKKAVENRRSTCPVCVRRETNPVKIYCKKCFVSVKLDKLLTSSTQLQISQFASVECSSCKKPSNNDSFSQSQLTENPERKKPTNSKNQFQQGNGMTSDVKIHVNNQI